MCVFVFGDWGVVGSRCAEFMDLVTVFEQSVVAVCI